MLCRTVVLLLVVGCSSSERVEARPGKEEPAQLDDTVVGDSPDAGAEGFYSAPAVVNPKPVAKAKRTEGNFDPAAARKAARLGCRPLLVQMLDEANRCVKPAVLPGCAVWTMDVHICLKRIEDGVLVRTSSDASRLGDGWTMCNAEEEANWPETACPA